MKKYKVREKICISIDAMINGNADMDYVDIITDHDGDETFYMLLNESGEVCCLDGEECIIDHIITTTENIFDLVNNNGEKSVHFLLSEKDLGIAVFR